MSAAHVAWDIADEDLLDIMAPMEPEYVGDDLPVRASMRRSLLKVNGRRKGLKNLWDSPRFDSGRHSRSAAYPCHKDYRGAKSKDYRPWQEGVSEVLSGTELTNAELDIIALLEAEYLEIEHRRISICDKIELPWFALS